METISIRGAVSGLPITIQARADEGIFYCVKCGQGYDSTDGILRHSAGPCVPVPPNLSPGRVVHLPSTMLREDPPTAGPGHRTRVYIAGPITGSGSLLVNVGKAIRTFGILLKRGYAPYLPHLTCFAEIALPEEFSYEAWLALDQEYLVACDAFLRLEGQSDGADREQALAKRLDIPVYLSLDTLYACEKPVRSGHDLAGADAPHDARSAGPAGV